MAKQDAKTESSRANLKAMQGQAGEKPAPLPRKGKRKTAPEVQKETPAMRLAKANIAAAVALAGAVADEPEAPETVADVPEVVAETPTVTEEVVKVVTEAQVLKAFKKASPGAWALIKAWAQAVAEADKQAAAELAYFFRSEAYAASEQAPWLVENLYSVPHGEDWLKYALAGKFDAHGNEWVDVQMPPAAADLLNQVLDGMKYGEVEGKFTVTEAVLNTTPSQRGHMGTMHKAGYVAKQGKGYVLTDAGLGLYGSSWAAVEKMYYEGLGAYIQQSA